MTKNPNYTRLDFQGKERGFKFGIAYLSRLLSTYKMTMDEFMKLLSDNPFEAIPRMVLTSIEAADAAAKKETDVDMEMVTDWIDETGGLQGSFLQPFMEAWGNAMGTGEEAKADPDTEGVEILTDTAKKKEIGLTT